MGIKYLCRNTLRTFWKKKTQLFCIGIIIMLSALLYTMMYYTMDSMTLGIEKLAQAANQEDFSVEVLNAILPSERGQIPKEKQAEYATYQLTDLKRIDYKLYEGILKSRMKAFTKVYPDYNLEVRSYKDVNFTYGQGKHTIRLFKDGKDINKTYLIKGRMPETSNEIAIAEIYGKKNNLVFGDSLILGGKPYTLTGYVLFADMNLPMLGSDFIIDNGKITLGTLKDSAYERIQGEEHFYFAGKAIEPKAMETFKEDVEDDYKNHDTLKFVTGVVATKNQMRSGAIYEELRTGKAATLGISIIIAAIAVMIVGILVSKILRNEKTQIGVLKALGYHSWEIAMPYLLLLLVIGIPMLLIGYGIGVYGAGPMKDFYLEFYLLLNEPITTNAYVFITAVLVPLGFILGLSFFMIWRMLGKETIQLLKVGDKEKMTRLGKLIGKALSKTKAQTKFKYTFIFKNTGKFIVFFWGITFSSMLILLGFMMNGMFDKMTVEYYNQVDYQYEGYLDYAKPKPKVKTGQEKFLTVGNVFYEQEPISVKGLEKDNVLHKLIDKKGKDMTSLLADGFIVNQSFATTYGIKKGDTLTLQIEDRLYVHKVMGIANSYGDNTVYCEIEDLSRALTKNKSKKLYTGIYSKEALDEKMFMTVVDKQGMMEQTELMQGFIQVAMYAMFGSAIVMSSLILYVLTTLTVEDNYYNISLLKVMGYSSREVNQMILNSYLVYAILTYIISIPMTWVGVQAMVIYFSSAFDFVMPLELEGWHCIVGLGIILVIFLVGTWAAKRHIEKVSLQEALKAYRE
ncbi:MAG: ABC transporter permease [Niameybacter sp.]|uniref:ABC transporter permease n=1 Tax=Niameybacter sp. TaxID=2033640 RepID=UPI002FCAED79